MPNFLNLPAYEGNALINFQPVNQALEGYREGMEKAQSYQNKLAIGRPLAEGRYNDAAAKAFEVGEFDTGVRVKQLQIAQEDQQHRVIQRMAGLAQAAREEKDPARKAQMTQKFLGIKGVMDALPEAYRTGDAALDYIINSAREVGDELKMKYKSDLEREGLEADIRALRSGGSLRPAVPIGTGINPAVGKIAQTAAAAGRDPAMLLTISKMESDLGAVPTNPRSTAEGYYHFLKQNRDWAEAQGVPYGASPETQTAAMIAKMKSDADYFAARTGRQPQGYENYILHYQGGPLGTQLLNMNPRTPMNYALGPRAGEILRANPDLAKYNTVGDFLGDYKRRFGSTYASFAGQGAAPTQPATAAAGAATAAVAADPYLQLTQPAMTPEQEQADRMNRAEIELRYGRDRKEFAKILAKKEEPKEQQTKDAKFAERMGRTEITFRGITGEDNKNYNPGATANWFWPDNSMLNTTKWKQYQAAALEWITAKLRRESGAQVTEIEFDRDFRTYFPQPGDPLAVQKQKFDSRIQEARGMRAAAGPAFEQQYPNFDRDMRARLREQDPERYSSGKGQGTKPPPGDYIYDPATGQLVPRTSGAR